MRTFRRIRGKADVVGAIGVIGALGGLAALIFFVLPPLMVTSDEVSNNVERLKLQNDLRTTGVQLLAGAVLALGAFLTARTIRVNREGQITERYTRAIDQLGNSERDVRIGGIYALERIAKDARRDHERGHLAAWLWKLPRFPTPVKTRSSGLRQRPLRH